MSLAQQSQTWFPTHVQVTVLQAKALRSKGKASTNDAYAIIQLGKEKYSTTVAEKAVAPVWKEEATFEVPLLHNDNQERCTVRVIVMHRALVGMDKFLGQLELNLWELHQNKNRRKVQWYPLKSKPGKKEKERGQIEVEVQFMRNNMTASMFDLSMKEKSRSPFGKLKDKLKNKRRDGFPDTASAIVPSTGQYGDDSDEDMPETEKKKSKLKTLFNKQPGLKKNSISQSMSVLPTFQPSSQRTVLKPSDFSSDLNQASGSPVSERRFPNLPAIMTHKRTASADTKQLNQIASGNKKEGLSFFSGMKSKNDPITRSNLCINGNHVYMEEAEPRSESPKDNSLTNSPLTIRKAPLYASAENLSYKPPKETSSTSNNNPEKELSASSSNESLKSLTLPSHNNKGEKPRSGSPPLMSGVPKESKENKKQENKMSSLLSLVTGRKDSPKTTEVENLPEVPLKNDGPKATEGALKSERPSDNKSKKTSQNPFEDGLCDEKPPQQPQPPERGSKTSAVKPRLDVSSEAETKAKLSSSFLSNATFLEASFSGGQNALTASKLQRDTQNKTTLNYSPSTPDPVSNPLHEKRPNSPSESLESTEPYEKPSMPLFWRSGPSSSEPAEPKEVQVVAPFSEKSKVKKTYVKSLLDQLKGKSTSTSPTDVVDVQLVKGILPVHLGPPEDSDSLLDNKPEPVFESINRNSEGFTLGTDDGYEAKSVLSSEASEKYHDSVPQNVKEPPKPAPRSQVVLQKEEQVREVKPIPPKPAPRSASRINKVEEPVSESILASQPSQLMDKSSADASLKTKRVTEQASRVGASLSVSAQSITNIKMAMPVIDDLGYRLDELPVIPENPEGTSDDEQLESKNEPLIVERKSVSASKTSSVVPQNEKNDLYSTLQTNSALKPENNPADLTMEKDKKNTTNESESTQEGNKSFRDIPGNVIEDITRDIPKSNVDHESRDSNHPFSPENSSHTNSVSSSLSHSVTLPSDNTNTPRTESPTNPTSEASETSGKKKLLRAWVSPSETHPIPTVQSGGTVSSRQRTHPVKPMNTNHAKPSNVSQPIKAYENTLNAINTKKYDSSDPAYAYAQLTHDELIQLVLKQKETISKKESQVRELEDYIDNLLVRVMEETPNILRNFANQSKKAGRV
ncbi:rab11 family-interacting protein 1 [Spea bombifrons]|uniref:rab11 family-interacting protein 1 n=1 Tax=Spea bombifrons TaxID=233779 RepID=UPI00234A1758|nr:rab11 family-interacting protein 1 [Spea bombifrons]